MPCGPRYLPPLALLLSLAVAPSPLPAQNVDPVNPNACTLEEIGRMPGWITESKQRGWGQNFGMEIHAVGDLDNDALADWIVAYNQCDTLFPWGPDYDLIPVRLALYKGVRDSVPSPHSGTTIGSQTGSTTRFLATGRFDDDPWIDLVVGVILFSDTVPPADPYSMYRVVVYWGNGRGEYSDSDTTHLINTHEKWGLRAGGVIHRTTEPDALIIWGWTYDNGGWSPTAGIHVFESEDGGRWGREGRERTARWSWWNAPRVGRLQILDHDGDRRMDLAFLRDENAIGRAGETGIVYGRGDVGDHVEFDTIAIEAVRFDTIEGKVARLLDVTGDAIADLVVTRGDTTPGMTEGTQRSMLVYVGRQGRRLFEQYGSGEDPPDPGSGRPYARPWREILLPQALHSGWGPISYFVFDLGDVGNDGIDDPTPMLRPNIIVYSTGDYFDQYIDAIIPVPGGSLAVTRAARIGDIDGSGHDAIAVFYGWIPGGIAFYRTNACVERAGGTYNRVPPGTGKPTGEVVAPGPARPATLAARLSPNPSGGRFRLEWEGAPHASVSVYDPLGNEAARWGATQRAIALDLSRWPRGLYRVLVRTRDGVASLPLVLE